MKFIVEVNCEPGEDSTRVTDITQEQVNLLVPLLNFMFTEYKGSYRTGDYSDGECIEEHLYRTNFPEALEELEKRLPLPTHGFKEILNIEII